MKPLVSVIIPVFNRADLVRRAVESVLSQEYPRLELIVVDDHSSDHTLEVLASMADSGEFIIISHLANMGVSAARNSGLSAARGELIAFLDSDDEWLPGKIEAQVDYLSRHQDQMLVQTQEYWMRGDRRVNPGRRHLKKAGDIFIESVGLCLISPSAVMVRRSLLDEVGRFDENLRACEDYDLWLRVLAKYPAGLIDRALLIRHGGRPDQLSAQPGLDRFRVIALQKILKTALSPERRAAVEKELERRQSIYETGRAKRCLRACS